MADKRGKRAPLKLFQNWATSAADKGVTTRRSCRNRKPAGSLRRGLPYDGALEISSP
jgi:hypothetical protein